MAQNSTPASLEVGSRICAGCHAAIYRQYSGTGMARSSGRAGSATLQESFNLASFSDPASGVTYKVAPSSDGFRFQFSRSGGEVQGERTLQWFLGSGNVGRSYLFGAGSLLFQAPVSYYSALGKWDVSPGYAGRNHIFIRQIDASCLQCHASRVQTRAGMQNQFADPPFLEGGVSCERCHGPGKAHVDRMKATLKAKATGIVNPAKLNGWRRDSICAQCHLTGAARVARASRTLYRPGQLLSDSVSIFVWASPTAARTAATNHYEQFTQSRCKQASGDRLWCGSCHDPHDQPATETRAAYYRARCNTCHGQSPCTESLQVRQQKADDCVSCHMPKTASPTVDHIAFTNHGIVRGIESAALAPENVSQLIPFANTVADDRDLALAYAVVAPDRAAVRPRAFALLREAEARNPQDLAIVSQLAQFYDRMGNEEKAMVLSERIVQADPANTTAAVNLGIYYMKRGRADEAIALWRRALERNPALTGAALNLAIAQFQKGNKDESVSILAAALQFDPDNPTVRRMLSEIRSR